MIGAGENSRLLINGCSFSRGPQSWPYYLKTFDQTQFTNLALSSAGNTYIHEATVAELARRQYGAAIIMWSGPARIDTQVSDPNNFAGSVYTSAYQCGTNDWPEKVVEPVNDSDFVDRSWIFGLGHTNRDSCVYSSKLFDGHYRYLDLKQFVFHLLIKIISLQGVLKSLNIPYVFTLYQPYQNLFDLHPDLKSLIDWQCWYLEDNIHTIAVQNNDLDANGHPGRLSNEIWAAQLDRQVQNKILQSQLL